MKIRLVIAVGIAALICFSGCATYIGIQVKKPAELNIPPFKRIAILDFDNTGTFTFWYDNNKLSFEDIAKKIIIDKMGLDKGNRPDPKKAYPGNLISSKIVNALVQNGHYEVLERAALEKILAEHSLNMSGIIDESQAAQAGKLLGVDAILLGSGTYSITDGGDWYEYKEKIKREVSGDSAGTTKTIEETVTKKKFRATRSVNAEMAYRIILIETGRIVAAQSNRSSHKLTSDADRQEEAYKSLSDWQPALDNLEERMSEQTVRQVAPYFVYQNREIMGGTSRQMKNAVEYAKRNLIEEAKTLWEEASLFDSPKLLNDKVHAWYDLGVYAEVNNDLDKAELCFSMAYKLSGKGRFLDEQARIQERKREVARIKAQSLNP